MRKMLVVTAWLIATLGLFLFGPMALSQDSVSETVPTATDFEPAPGSDGSDLLAADVPTVVQVGSITVVDELGRTWTIEVETVNAQPRMRLMLDVDSSGTADGELYQPLTSYYSGISGRVDDLVLRIDGLVGAMATRATQDSVDGLRRDLEDMFPPLVPVNAGDPININTATSEQLQTLPGIGSALAVRIIDARPITSLADLAERVSGIGYATAAGLDGLVVFEDGTVTE